jgi:hypothetical protein
MQINSNEQQQNNTDNYQRKDEREWSLRLRRIKYEKNINSYI